LLISSLISFSACSDSEKVVVDSDSKKGSIVASFYPLAFFAERIVGDNLDVINLAGKKDVHDFNPSPRDIANIGRSNLFIFQGAGIEPWAEDMLVNLSGDGVSVLEVSSELSLHEISDDSHDDHDDHEGHDEHDEHDDHDEEEEEYDDHDSHDHGAYDPHTWLSPVMAQDMIRVILKSIVSIDPSSANLYESNASALLDEMLKYDKEMKKIFSSCKLDEVISSHDSFGYLARSYGFTIHPIAGISTGDEPSAAVLAELKEEASEGISHILVEDNGIKRFAEMLSRETGLELLMINSLESGSEDFFSGYEKNINSFKTALECQ
jgi:zinc transport system substrate-binding protein